MMLPEGQCLQKQIQVTSFICSVADINGIPEYSLRTAVMSVLT